MGRILLTVLDNIREESSPRVQDNYFCLCDFPWDELSRPIIKGDGSSVPSSFLCCHGLSSLTPAFRDCSGKHKDVFFFFFRDRVALKCDNFSIMSFHVWDFTSKCFALRKHNAGAFMNCVSTLARLIVPEMQTRHRFAIETMTNVSV